ncbi:MAG TPA: ATP-grasp domain-containing protein [Beijerinckiaceae bacterium]|nr:ATP-grasp domain-containing protein [Beijerinckiaceae bacterium]
MSIRVLVFPSANEPGLEILQALAKSNKIELLAGSSFDRAYDPSRVLVERHLECPALGEPDFRARFEPLLRRHAVDLVFPTVDAVVAEFAGWRDPVACLVTSLPHSAMLVMSKRQTYARLEGHVAVPRIFDGDAPLPCYAKPDIGSGSRGGFLVETAQDLDLARRRSLLVHELLPGPEYTVDCLSGLDGGLMFANVRVRGQVARGISVGTTGLCRPDIEDSVRRIAARIPLRGPWFAQFKEARDGTPTLLEVNARVSGSMTLTRLSGVNIPLIAVFMFMGYAITVPRLLQGVRVNRFLRTVIWDLDDTLVRKDGKVDPDVVARLYDLHNQSKRQLLLTKNVDPEAALARLSLPRLFEEVRGVMDKPAGVSALIRDWDLDPARCVMINDSIIENLAIQALHPTLRVVQPDALDLLQREKLR